MQTSVNRRDEQSCAHPHCDNKKAALDKSKVPAQSSQVSNSSKIPTRTYSNKETEPFLRRPSESGLVRSEPESFKIGRDYAMQSADVERDLLSAILDPKSLEDTGATVTPLPANISEYGLTSYIQAVQQILYNQSVLARNDDINSGFDRRVAKPGIFGESAYVGSIFVSLNELCRKAYGVKDPTTEQRRQMEELIYAVDRFFPTIKYPKKGSDSVKLIACMGRYKRESDGELSFCLYLNPIFCGEGIMQNFGEFPQDLTKRLRQAICEVSVRRGSKRHAELSANLLRLVQHLGVQDKRKPCKWSLPNMLNHLGLTQSYKKDSKRIQEKLDMYFEVLKEIGLLNRRKSNNPERGMTLEGEKFFIFHFDPNFRKQRGNSPQLDKGRG